MQRALALPGAFRGSAARSCLAVLCLSVLCVCHSTPDEGAGAVKRDTEPGDARNPGPVSDATMAIVGAAPAVYVYRYAETIEQIDPYRDYRSIRKLTDGALIRDIKALVRENRDYQPQFTARCLPVWDYALEFRKSESERRLFLFSFRCNTMMSFEDRAYRDFSPQAVRLYALIRYEINDRSSADASRP